MSSDIFTDGEGNSRLLRGVTLYSGSPLLAGLAAQVGFEVVWIKMEHGPAGFERVEVRHDLSGRPRYALGCQPERR